MMGRWWRPAMAPLAAVLLAAPNAGAQSVVKILAKDFENAGRDFVSIWASPFDASRKDYLIALGVLGAGAVVSPLDDNVDRWAVSNRDRGFLHAIKPFRRGGTFYTVNKVTPYLGGLYVVGVAINHQGIRDGILGCLSAYAANTTIRHQLVYRIVGRDRPETSKNVGGEGDPAPQPPAEQGDQYDFHIPAKNWGQHSFPGGHVANMATCAAFFGHRFDWKYADPVLAGLVAVMGIGRLPDRGHWLSDQVVGTAFGYAIGREVARRQLARLKKSSASATGGAEPADAGAQFFMQPSVETVRLGWTVRF
jgi:membrane-associated phospholipid phosphatase